MVELTITLDSSHKSVDIDCPGVDFDDVTIIAHFVNADDQVSPDTLMILKEAMQRGPKVEADKESAQEVAHQEMVGSLEVEAEVVKAEASEVVEPKVEDAKIE